jgi:hypothetical protein
MRRLSHAGKQIETKRRKFEFVQAVQTVQIDQTRIKNPPIRRLERFERLEIDL